MGDPTVNNKRIAKNTAFLYMRMLLITVVTLYTSRVVLEELGVLDFGVFNVVAGVVAMLGFLKSSMSLSVQRFLSYEMGIGNKERINKIFNLSLFAHIILAVIVVMVAETIGLWFVKTQLVIPAERINSAVMVYHCVVFSSVLSVLQVPYDAMLIASEKFNIYAYVSIFEVALKLISALLLMMNTFDKLEFYGFLNMAVAVIIMVTYMLYVILKYPETKLRLLWDSLTLKHILSFSFWSLLGELAWVFVLQGINILINIFCGPVVNAARAISYQVNTAVSNFSRSFQQAVNPQLIKLYAVGNNKEMEILLWRGTKISFFLMFLITLPLLLETPFILNLWLKNVPEHTVLFCQLVLIGGLIDALSNLLATIAKAYGKIRNYQIVVSFVLMLNFPCSYIFLKYNFFPEVTMYIYMILSLLLLFVRLYLTKRMVGLSVKRYFLNVIYPIMKVTVASLVILLLIHSMFGQSLLRFFVTGFSTLLIVGIISLYLGFDRMERESVVLFIKSKFRK